MNSDTAPGAGTAIVAILEGVVAGDGADPPGDAPGGDDLAGLVAHLGRINAHQWWLEDDCRDRYDDDAAVADLKRRIDSSNLRRVATVDRIDAAVADRLGPGAPDAAPAAVTPGDVIDRLSVLVLKRHHASGRPTAEGRVALAAAEARLADLVTAYDLLVESLASGALRYRAVPTAKLYGSG